VWLPRQTTRKKAPLRLPRPVLSRLQLPATARNGVSRLQFRRA